MASSSSETVQGAEGPARCRMLTSIKTERDKIEIVNQLLLPHCTEYIEINTIEEAHDAIKTMKVNLPCFQEHLSLLTSFWQIRGAPAIASLAALTFAANLSKALETSPTPPFLSSPEALQAHVTPILDYLYTARPTAVNLGAATRRIARKFQSSKDAGKDTIAIARDLVAEARLVSDEDYSRNMKMATYGGSWLVAFHALSAAETLNVLTVCNTGSLATSVCGTFHSRFFLMIPATLFSLRE